MLCASSRAGSCVSSIHSNSTFFIFLAKSMYFALSGFDPGHQSVYESNAEAFVLRLEQAQDEWQPLLQKLAGKSVVFYHNSWPYFARFCGIRVVDFIEPKPGVPPSPGHIRRLVETIKSGEIGIIAMEPYFEYKVPEMLAAKTGARIVVVSPSVGGVPEADSYLAMIEYNLRALAGE